MATTTAAATTAEHTVVTYKELKPHSETELHTVCDAQKVTVEFTLISQRLSLQYQVFVANHARFFL